MTILPLTYLGNTEYFGILMRGECIIDIHENYVKQSYRNRCEIMTANGVSSLTVNVREGGSAKKHAMCDIRTDNSKRWQHQHWRAMISAYGKSPYFEHYIGYFEKFYLHEYEYLSEFSIGLLETVTKLLKIPTILRYSDSYVTGGENDLDLRGYFKPSKSITDITRFKRYEQVFSDRQEFRANLSVIDLLFCEGPSAKDFL